MTDTRQKEKKGKGFAGIDSMLSDVSEDVAKAAKTDRSRAHSDVPLPTVAPPAHHAEPSSNTAPAASSPPKKQENPAIVWSALIFVVVVVWSNYSGSGNKGQSAPLYTEPSPNSAIAHDPDPVPIPSAALVLDEQIPPMGRGLVLSIPQIRWCKREKIQIEAIKGSTSAPSEYEVARFNGKVDDYNSRCATFRYRQGDVEQVEREFASKLESIATNAISDWRSSSLVAESPPAAVTSVEAPSEASEQATAPQQDADTSTPLPSDEEH